MLSGTLIVVSMPVPARRLAQRESPFDDRTRLLSNWTAGETLGRSVSLQEVRNFRTRRDYRGLPQLRPACSRRCQGRLG